MDSNGLTAEIISAEAAALEITTFLLPYIGMVMIVVLAFIFKDYTTKWAKGIAFKLEGLRLAISTMLCSFNTKFKAKFLRIAFSLRHAASSLRTAKS